MIICLSWGDISSFHTSIESSWHQLPTSGAWFHDQVMTFGFDHQGVSFYSNV